MKQTRRLILAALLALAVASAVADYPPGPSKTAAGDYPPGPYKSAAADFPPGPYKSAGISAHDSSETGA